MIYNNKNYLRIIKDALREDIGKRDITTLSLIPGQKIARAFILAKEPCVVCGLDLCRDVFKTVDNKISFKAHSKDGRFVKKGTRLATLEGRAQSILTAERVALNFISLLSGVATKTRLYVLKVKPYNVRIVDTRKTIPGLRVFQKYAVRVAGGYNHRLSLDEMMLIKDNHIFVCCGRRSAACIGNLVKSAIAKKRDIKLEIEVENLNEFKAALKEKPDIIMLDNMSVKEMKKAVKIKNGTPYSKISTLIEASGRITLDNVRKVASCGVDMISLGDLTHTVRSVDVSLEFIKL